MTGVATPSQGVAPHWETEKDLSSKWIENVGGDIRVGDIFFNHCDCYRASADAKVMDGIARVYPAGGGEFTTPADMPITVLREV